MDDIQLVSVDLPDGQARELEAAVAAGEYPSVGKAVEAAVELWIADRMIDRLGVERLRRNCEQAIAIGDPQPLDFAQFREEAEHRLDVALAERRRLA